MKQQQKTKPKGAIKVAALRGKKRNITNKFTDEAMKVDELQKQLDEKEVELAKLLTDKEKLEAYAKKTLQKFQDEYLVALKECKAKLKEKNDTIEALEIANLTKQHESMQQKVNSHIRH